MKVAYVFATSGHTASYKLGKMILPQLEAGNHGVEVVGMFFFDDNNYILRQGDPVGERRRSTSDRATAPGRSDGRTIMSIIVSITLPGVSAAEYDSVRTLCNHLQVAPEGGQLHTVWWEGDACRIVDAWESDATFGAFAENILGPALAEAGVEAEAERVKQKIAAKKSYLSGAGSLFKS